MEEENKVIEESKKMNWLIPVVVIIIITGGVYFVNNNKSKPTKTTQPTSSATTNTTADVSDIISIEGGMFYFKPNEIRVKKDETVKITFNNKEGLHDFVLEKFNIKTNQIKAGESETVELTPNELGEFDFYCSVSDHKQKGMVGKLIVVGQ